MWRLSTPQAPAADRADALTHVSSTEGSLGSLFSFPKSLSAMTTAAPVVATRLTALGALAYALCWLLPNHHVPWVDFYSDAWAALVLGVVGSVVLWCSRRDAPLAWHALPLMTLAWLGIVWVQYGAGLIQMLGVAWTSGLYLTGLTLALLLGAAWERWRPGECADFLFMAVLAGATGSLLIQLQQWLSLNPGAAFWLFAPAPRARFYANLGQPNQLASLLCLGVLGCAWLYQRGLLLGWLALLWALPLALGIALTESRTSWVVVLLSVAVLIVWRQRLMDARPIMAGVLSWTGVFALCVVALPHVNAWLGRRDQLRSLGDISTGNLRLEYWAKLWEALLHRPWSGFGWTQTSFAQFTADPYDMVTGGTMRHAHNLVMDIGVGMGIPLGLAVSLALALWVLRAVRCISRLEQMLMLLFVTALGIHAMLEFPLHYAYFLLPIGMMMGALSVTLDFRPVLRSSRWVAGVAMALAMLGLGVTAYDYIRIEDDFFALRFEHQRLAPQGAYAAPDTLALSHLQDMLWLARIDPAQTHSEEDLARAVQVTKLLPSLVAMYKIAAMYALAGQPEQVRYWITVMTRMNHLKESVVLELQRQWEAQSIAYPPMTKVAWPD